MQRERAVHALCACNKCGEVQAAGGAPPRRCLTNGWLTIEAEYAAREPPLVSACVRAWQTDDQQSGTMDKGHVM